MSDEITSKKKLEALESILKKNHGDRYYAIKGTNKLPPIEWSSSGYYAVDYVMGKGVPKGRFIQVTGWESVGKTWLALELAARYQKDNKLVYWIEAGEASFDRDLASYIGLDVDNIGFLKADTAEKAAESIRDILKAGIVDLLIVDSIAGFIPEKEIEDELAAQNMCLLSRLLSKALKQYKTLMDKHGTTMVVINQIRAKPGVTYGNPETLCTGNAIKYYSDIILRMSKIKTIEKGKVALGIISKVKATKNKCHVPFREKEINIKFPYEENGIMKAGIDIIEDLIPEAITQGVISQGGAYYTWKGFPEDAKSNSNRIKSKDSVIEYFKQNTNLLDLLKADLLNNTNHDTISTQEDSSEEDYEEEAA
jgi:recombination protein RecA